MITFINESPLYINEIFKHAGYFNTNTIVSFLKLNQPLGNTNHGQTLRIFGTNCLVISYDNITKFLESEFEIFDLFSVDMLK